MEMDAKVDVVRDRVHMVRALSLAAQGLNTTMPNPRVGCVIASGARVLGEGFHRHAGAPHAEVEALAVAGSAARGATAYITLEPCVHHGRTPPCVEALIAAGIQRVVFAATDPNPLVSGAGERALNVAGIVVRRGVLEAEARELNRGFFMRHEHGRPYVCLKVGASVDGRVALASGQSQWITGAPARADVQRLRARSCAVLTGIGTVCADDPRLTVRDPNIDVGDRQPLRVVLDSRARMPRDAKLLQVPGDVVVITDRDHVATNFGKASVDAVRSHGRGLDIIAVLEKLSAREINEILVEAGPGLAGAFLELGLVDELIYYLAPLALGSGARPMFEMHDLEALSAGPRFQIVEAVPVGADLRIILRAYRA